MKEVRCTYRLYGISHNMLHLSPTIYWMGTVIFLVLNRISSPFECVASSSYLNDGRLSHISATFLKHIRWDSLHNDGVVLVALCLAINMVNVCLLRRNAASMIFVWIVSLLRCEMSRLNKRICKNLRIIDTYCHNMQQALKAWAHQVMCEYACTCSKIRSLPWLTLDQFVRLNN